MHAGRAVSAAAAATLISACAALLVQHAPRPARSGCFLFLFISSRTERARRRRGNRRTPTTDGRLGAGRRPLAVKGLLGKANVRFCSTAAVLLEQRSFLPAAQGAERPHTPRSREGAAGRVHVQVHARPPNEVHLGWQGVADARGEVRFLRAPLACLPTGPPDIQLVASRPKQRLKEGVRNWAQPMAPSMGIRWFIWIR